MFNKDFKLSQSCLKDFENPSVCLEEFKGRWVTKTLPFPSNEKMDYGSYFEYLCIGANSGYDDPVTDLPRKNNGEKRVAQIRIEEQVNKFNALFSPDNIDYCWLKIKNIQMRLAYENQTGILDIAAEDIFDNKPHIVDLKLTSDVDATHHPAMFGHNEHIDITQATHYAWLWEKIHGVRPIFSYFVFDYKPESKFKRIDVEVSDEDINELNERKRKVFDFVYNTDPEEDWKHRCNCDKCSSL